MQIEFIYTFNDSRDQEILSKDITKMALQKSIKSEKALKQFAIGLFFFNNKEDITDSILKISSCVYLQGNTCPKIPDWYLKCSGKLWFEQNRWD